MAPSKEPKFGKVDPEVETVRPKTEAEFKYVSKRKVAAFVTGEAIELAPPKGTPRKSTRALSRALSPSPSRATSPRNSRRAQKEACTSQADEMDSQPHFLLRPHTITVLMAMLGYLLYIALTRTCDDKDIYFNTKYGVLAVIFVFQIIGTLMLSDGPFIRPHPVVWRWLLSLGISYLLILIFFLFQSLSTTRYLVSLFDPSLGVPLAEVNYASDCGLHWENIKEKLDFFVFAHAFGWFVKAFILRDPWILWIISIMFEVMEYSLVYQLPNFAECWWDHWILDVAFCNAIGIYFGMKACDYFKLKTYDWRAADFESRGKSGFISRVKETILPADWTSFAWAATSGFKNYLVTIFVVAFFLIAELNAFYLKHLLWIPPNHTLNWIRIVLICFVGLMGTREVYEYYTNPRCKRFGSSAWLTIAIIVTEVILIIKFGKNEIPFMPPSSVINFWIVFIACLIFYPIYLFVLKPKFSMKKNN